MKRRARIWGSLLLAGVASVWVMSSVQAGWGGFLKDALQKAAPKPAESAAPAETAPETRANPLDLVLGAVKTATISEEDERRIGAQIAGNVLGVSPLVPDEGLQRYVNRVGRWVALQSERPDLPWRFGVIESSDINAFAAPGGFILLTRGLYAQLKNEAELAGVLAHEIGHVISRHHLKVLQKSQLVGALGQLAGQKARQQWAQNLIGNGAEIVARGLDKEAEFEADRIGVVLAARAGYDAYALPAVLQAIGHVSAQDNRVALLFKTHPHPDVRFERLADAVGERLDSLPPGQQLEGRLYRLGER